MPKTEGEVVKSKKNTKEDLGTAITEPPRILRGARGMPKKYPKEEGYDVFEDDSPEMILSANGEERILSKSEVREDLEKYLSGDPQGTFKGQWPIFWNRQLSTETVAALLACQAVSEKLICQSVPQDFASGRGAFLVALDRIGDNPLETLEEDGVQGWDTPTLSQHYYLDSPDVPEDKRPMKVDREEEANYKIVEKRFRNSISKDFIRHIWYGCRLETDPLSDEIIDGSFLSLGVIYYYGQPQPRTRPVEDFDELRAFSKAAGVSLGRTKRGRATTFRTPAACLSGANTAQHFTNGHLNNTLSMEHENDEGTFKESPQFYFEWPIFCQHMMHLLDACKILLGLVEVPQEHICHSVPQNYKQTGTFVIDLRSLQNRFHIGRDGMGLWGKPAGHNRFFLQNEAKDNDGNVTINYQKSDKYNYDIKVSSRYCHYPTAPDFHRRIFYAFKFPSVRSGFREDKARQLQNEDEGAAVFPLGIVSYGWIGGDPFDFELKAKWDSEMCGLVIRREENDDPSAAVPKKRKKSKRRTLETDKDDGTHTHVPETDEIVRWEFRGLPLFSNKVTQFTEAIKILLGAKQVDDNLLCHLVPQGFQSTGTFVVDTRHLNPHQDPELLLKDDSLGRWSEVLGVSRYYKLAEDGSGDAVRVDYQGRRPECDFDVQVLCRRAEHPNTNWTFCRKIYTAHQPGIAFKDSNLYLAVIVYFWKEGSKPHLFDPTSKPVRIKQPRTFECTVDAGLTPKGIARRRNRQIAVASRSSMDQNFVHGVSGLDGDSQFYHKQPETVYMAGVETLELDEDQIQYVDELTGEPVIIVSQDGVEVPVEEEISRAQAAKAISRSTYYNMQAGKPAFSEKGQLLLRNRVKAASPPSAPKRPVGKRGRPRKQPITVKTESLPQEIEDETTTILERRATIIRQESSASRIQEKVLTEELKNQERLGAFLTKSEQLLQQFENMVGTKETGLARTDDAAKKLNEIVSEVKSMSKDIKTPKRKGNERTFSSAEIEFSRVPLDEPSESDSPDQEDICYDDMPQLESVDGDDGNDIAGLGDEFVGDEVLDFQIVGTSDLQKTEN